MAGPRRQSSSSRSKNSPRTNSSSLDRSHHRLARAVAEDGDRTCRTRRPGATSRVARASRRAGARAGGTGLRRSGSTTGWSGRRAVKVTPLTRLVASMGSKPDAASSALRRASNASAVCRNSLTASPHSCETEKSTSTPQTVTHTFPLMRYGFGPRRRRLPPSPATVSPSTSRRSPRVSLASNCEWSEMNQRIEADPPLRGATAYEWDLGTLGVTASRARRPGPC